MTSSEYRNTVYWTLHAHTPADETDLLITARRIFNNLGVPFPQGTLDGAVRILSSGDYMGWSICNADLAQQCANNGYPAIAVIENTLSFILPEEHTVAVNSPVAAVDHPIIWESGSSSSAQYFVFARLLDNNDVTLKNSDVVSQQNSGIMVAAATTTTCSSSCQVACQSCNTCQTSCELNCQTGCQVSCQTTCQASCQTGCQVSCQSCNSCQSSCETSCQNTCESSCQDTCQTSCQVGCEVACQSCNTCQSTCESICQDTCQTSCQTGCQISCQSCDACQSNCELSCQTGCQVSCQSCNSCQATCESVCQDTCQSSCQTGCQVVCDDCQNAGETATPFVGINKSSIDIDKYWSGKLDITVSPVGYTPTLIWSSSNENVATINEQTGTITPVGNGTTTISVHVVGENISDSCTVSVDMREKVIVEYHNTNDGDYFTVTFQDSGAIWKSIGCDLDIWSNRSGNTISRDYWDDLNIAEKNYLENFEYVANEDYEYTVDEYALLYLLDPIGVQFFIKHEGGNNSLYLPAPYNNQCWYEIPHGTLYFKDALYRKIFSPIGHDENKFFFKMGNNNQIQYYLDPDPRDDYYSYAEILFGFHAIIDVNTFLTDVLEYLFGFIPMVSEITLGVELYQALFFKGAVDGIVSDAASTALETYVSECIDNSYSVFHKLFGWTSTLFSTFNALLDAVANSVTIPVIGDIQTYERIKEQTSYKVIMKKNNNELTMSEIIERFNTTNT